MRKEHKPLIVKKFLDWVNCIYIKQFIAPQFSDLGIFPQIIGPRSLRIFGHNIAAGDHLHLISDPCQPVNLSTWQSKQQSGHITIGDHVLISPGVNICSAESVKISDNCMLAAKVYISDSDWHGTYNRTRPFRCSAPTVLGKNVWLGYRSIVGKGVSIGENSIVGAGSVVTQNVPSNVIVAGNPAKIVKKILPERKMLARDYLFQDGERYWQQQQKLDAYLLADNTVGKWLKTKICPSQND